MADPTTARNDAQDDAHELTYVLLDGENIDATLGISLLGRRPERDDRPRWERVLEFAAGTWGKPVRALFFINASNGYVPMPFVQALQAMGIRPILLSGASDTPVVDVGIQRTMTAIATRGGHVLLASHDGDFLPQVEQLLTPGRRVGLLAFREFINAGYGALKPRGLEVYDLEDDARCFIHPLPRTRVIPIDEFDPLPYL